MKIVPLKFRNLTNNFIIIINISWIEISNFEVHKRFRQPCGNEYNLNKGDVVIDPQILSRDH